jgi:hypothetical protein
VCSYKQEFSNLAREEQIEMTFIDGYAYADMIASFIALKEEIATKKDRNSSLALTNMRTNARNTANCYNTGFRWIFIWSYHVIRIFLLISMLLQSSCDCKPSPISNMSKSSISFESKPQLPSDEPLPSAHNAIVFSTAEYNALYELFIATDGANWRWQVPYEVKGQPWNFNTTTANPCIDQWQGITCNEKNNEVSLLQLTNYSLTGNIPASLGNLTSLLELYLDYNNLTGNIPASLSDLTSLQVLDLDNNHLTGNIPASLGDLTSLLELYLDYNYSHRQYTCKLGRSH